MQVGSEGTNSNKNIGNAANTKIAHQKLTNQLRRAVVYAETRSCLP